MSKQTEERRRLLGRQKQRVATALYRHPRLYRAVRPVWAQARWLTNRAWFGLTRATGRGPRVDDAIITLRPDQVTRVVGTEARASQGWEAATRPLELAAELRELAGALLAGAEPAALEPRLASVGAHSTDYGFRSRAHLEGRIATLKSSLSPDAVGLPCVDVWVGPRGEFAIEGDQLSLAVALEAGWRSLRARVQHRDPAWKRFRDELAFEARRAGKLYQRVIHPDLEVFPTVQICSDRIDLLRDRVPRGSGLAVDLGANSGQYSMFLEDLGYRVTAVEEDPIALHQLRLGRDALGYRFEIFAGDIRDYRPAERLALLCAMSVLHFFLKTPDDEATLVALLERLDPERIIFQPPRSDEYTNFMHKIYEPDEFAARIAEWSGLERVENLGLADNGRPIYLIS